MTQGHFHVAVAGSGFGGICTAIKLQDQGVTDLVIFERADDIGGTWRDNSYPGCACDVQSHLYSFSFAPNPDWSRTYSPQPEIWDYLRKVAEDYDVAKHVRLNHEVIEAAWDNDEQLWRIETGGGNYTADVFVSAVGALSEPVMPDLPGLTQFKGPVFHSAQWDHDHDVTGKRVAAIGTGASAIQFVPAIQPKVQHLTLFQRTPPWVIPRSDRRITDFERRLFKAFPATQKAARAAIYWGRELLAVAFIRPVAMKVVGAVAKRHLKKSVPDPALRQKLTPNYTIGCKRILIHNDYLPSLTQPNVEVVTEGIDHITADAVVSADGREHPADMIVLGTGFHAADPPIATRVRGKDGRTLQEHWEGSPKAHLGVAVAGFPNFFMLMGPNTTLGHSSVIFMIESQVEHVVKVLDHLNKNGTKAIEPTQHAQNAYVAEIDRKMRHTVWSLGGCNSWYIDDTGRNSVIWPGFTFTYRRRLQNFDPGEYQPVTAPREDPVAA